jgi:hypothetical protein
MYYNNEERAVGICHFFTHHICMHIIGFTSALLNLGRHGSLQLFIHFLLSLSLVRVLALSCFTDKNDGEEKIDY